MRLATVLQSQEMDRRSQMEFALSGEILMEAAGALAARECLQTFVPETQTGRIAILCGPGGNGADGLVMARHLASLLHTQSAHEVERGGRATLRRVTVFLLAPQVKRTPLFEAQLHRLQLQNFDVHSLEKTKPVYNDVNRAWEFTLMQGQQTLRVGDFAIWVDALFGIGFKNELREPASLWVNAINQSATRRLSLDTPSGLDADRGVILGTAFRADRTLTFGCAKAGFTVNDGPQVAGHVKIVPIGFPLQVVQETAKTHHYVTRTMARGLKPKRPASSNKTKSGHAIIFAGHTGMWGAGVLSSTAAYRVGSGYVTLASHDDPSKIVNQHPEILTQVATSEKLWSDAKWKVAGIGPGLGADLGSATAVGQQTAELLRRLRQRQDDGLLKAAVLDADAITVAANMKMFPLPESWIVTPHAGELARILLSDPEWVEMYPDASVLAGEIERDRFRFSKAAAKITGCWVLLKGFRTVITHAGKDKFWVIGSGNAALAKAGTGDVLTGFITGLLSQGLSPVRAACLGAYVHGAVADEWLQSGSDILSLESSDLIRRVSDTLARL